MLSVWAGSRLQSFLFGPSKSSLSLTVQPCLLSNPPYARITPSTCLSCPPPHPASHALFDICEKRHADCSASGKECKSFIMCFHWCLVALKVLFFKTSTKKKHASPYCLKTECWGGGFPFSQVLIFVYCQLTGLPISTYAKFCHRKLQKVAITGGKKVSAA